MPFLQNKYNTKAHLCKYVVEARNIFCIYWSGKVIVFDLFEMEG